AEEPPVSGQLEREVAAVLSRRPTGEPASAYRRAEESRKRAQPVIPVVIAGDRKNVWRLVRISGAERAFVWRDQSTLVLAPAGRGVDLVATENEKVTTYGSTLPPGLARELQHGLRRSVGDGIDGVPPVPGVAHVVDPDLVACALAVSAGTAGVVLVVNRVVIERRLACRDRLHETRIRALSNHERGELLCAGHEQLARIEPTHHRESLGARAAGRPQQWERGSTTGEASSARQRLPLARGIRAQCWVGVWRCDQCQRPPMLGAADARGQGRPAGGWHYVRPATKCFVDRDGALGQWRVRP